MLILLEKLKTEYPVLARRQSLLCAGGHGGADGLLGLLACHGALHGLALPAVFPLGKERETDDLPPLSLANRLSFTTGLLRHLAWNEECTAEMERAGLDSLGSTPSHQRIFRSGGAAAKVGQRHKIFCNELLASASSLSTRCQGLSRLLEMWLVCM